ncbi:hypothetical protein ACQPW1_09030 [Nocardia sp. CA-128927]|uniref:hypothetical protein n=1 Tax=Nocardia sp. CA-128927 TaxID=3239975 RepID=UPI003D9947F9
MRLGFSGSVLAAIGALLVAPAMIATPAATAAVVTVTHLQSPTKNGDSEWWGRKHPGQTDPSDPTSNKWNCDRKGNWHNDEHDSAGHADSRCEEWPQ